MCVCFPIVHLTRRSTESMTLATRSTKSVFAVELEFSNDDLPIICLCCMIWKEKGACAALNIGVICCVKQ